MTFFCALETLDRDWIGERFVESVLRVNAKVSTGRRYSPAIT